MISGGIMGKRFTSLIETKQPSTRPNTEMGQKKNTYHGVRYSSVQRPNVEPKSPGITTTAFHSRKCTQTNMTDNHSFETETDKVSSHVTSGNNLTSKFVR